MDYSTFVHAQQNALIGEFFADPGQCYVGVPALEKLSARYHGRGSWQPLPAASPNEAVIYRRPTGESELWVVPNDKAVSASGAYRTHWAAYVTAMGATGLTAELQGRTQNIDHLLPGTFAARQGYAYVRLMAVDARGNLTVGSVVERSMAHRDKPGLSFLADWFTVAKASCFRGSFAKQADPAKVMAELRQHIASRGFQLPAQLDTVNAHGMEAILRWCRSV